MTKPTYLSYWGKSASGEIPDFHPLAWHCLDVAAVVAAVLDGDPLLLRRIAELAYLDMPTVRAWLPVVAALHDLGKFGRGFQHQAGELRDRISGVPWPEGRNRPANSPRHDALGLVLWRNSGLNLAGHLDVRDEGNRVPAAQLRHRLEPWIAAATGHHGRPAFEDRPLPELLEAADRAAVQDWVRALVTVLKPGPFHWPVGTGDELLKASSWLVAGLVTLADWLGSNQAYFRYSPGIEDVVDYWDMAQTRARRAVRESGLLPRGMSLAVSLADLAPGAMATPLQKAVAAEAVPTGPQLHVIEDLTGSGKTEAALLLAHRMNQQGLGNGVYFALPTMATSNGMYARAAAWRRGLFGDDAPEIVLAHAQAERVLRAPAGDPSRYGKEGDVPAGQMRQSWLADNRKKALLAQIGIGTVDQALLGILKVKHSTLRQLGVARNILVIDEVHAFDRYTGRLIEVLLELQALHGGSAIVLSATLTQELRQKLVNAFWKGLVAARRPAATPELEFGEQPTSTPAPAPACVSMRYPMWTQASAGGAVEKAIAASPGSCRRLPVRFVHTEADALADVDRAAKAGLCAVWIRNTVDDALRAMRALRDAGLPAEVFHARMMAGDRARVEKEVLSQFGKGSGPGRAGQVLVATQVVEQSLDIDFDVMISDLAPADLLIQRAGRLHRHSRNAKGALTAGPDERPMPELLVLAPEWSDEPEANWLTGLLAGTEAVYRDPAMLWRTQKVLQDRGAIDLPLDARHLVEAAVAGEEVPEAFVGKSNRAEGEGWAKAGLAGLNQIQPASGYFSADALAQWHEDAEMPTRLGDPTVRLRLARLDGGRLLPLCSAWQEIWDWFDADVQVRAGRVTEPLAAMVAHIANAEAGMPDGGRWTTTVVLSEDADRVWRGQGIEYRKAAGLSFAGKGHRT
jgi:CRISPR-associated endonuclease/helicase Cas3